MKIMKISGAVIQERNISVNTSNEFEATYKGKQIYITTDHGHGESRWDHLTRYDINVIDLASGMHDVFTYGDFHTMRDAIRDALKGACLLTDKITPSPEENKKP